MKRNKKESSATKRSQCSILKCKTVGIEYAAYFGRFAAMSSLSSPGPARRSPSKKEMESMFKISNVTEMAGTSGGVVARVGGWRSWLSF